MKFKKKSSPLKLLSQTLLKWSLGGPLPTKFSCATIMVRGRDHQTQFWKRTIQWLFYQNFVPIGQLVPDQAPGSLWLKFFSLKPFCQMNQNLVGSIFRRSSVKFAHFVPIR
jgi:hypothetical protein